MEKALVVIGLLGLLIPMDAVTLVTIMEIMYRPKNATPIVTIRHKMGDVRSIGACKPKIFFINGFLCFLEDEWQWNGEGRERGNTTSRRR